MVRPTGWDVLGLDGDPTPGVVESVQALAREFGDFAHDVEAAYRSLNSFGSDASALKWIGQTADAFKGQFGPLPGRLQKLYTSYSEASDALSAYAPLLQAAQTKADAALRQAQDAHTDLQRATSTATNAASDLKTAQQNQAANPDQKAVTDAQTAHDTAQTNLDNAKAKMAALTKQANDAYNDRITAAKTCASALHKAQGDGIHNKSWWDHVGEDLSEWGGKIAEIANDLAPFLDVLALATSWIPGVDVITAALAEADNIIALVGTGMQIAGDAMQGHWGDALMGAGMLGLTFLGGKAIGSLGGKLAGKLGREAEEGAEGGIGAEARAAEGGKTSYCERDPIDVVSGWMLAHKTDLALPGALPVVLRRSYASGYTTGRLFGPGWSSTLDQRIAVNAAGIHFAGDDSQTIRFPIPASAEAVLPDRGRLLSLVWDRGLDEIRISDPDTRSTLHFPTVHHRDEIGEIRDVAAISDRHGNRVAIVRAEDGTPTLVEHPAYRVAVDTIRTAQGPRISSLRLLGDDSGAHVAAFGYDAHGRLTTLHDSPDAEPSLRYEYDADDRICAWTDQLDHRYSYEYDRWGRVIGTDGTAGYLSGSFQYDDDQRRTTHLDSFGQATVYEYDELGHVTAITNPLGGVSHLVWDHRGELLSSTDEMGGTTAYTVDDQGDTVQTTRPDGAVTTTVYNDLHLPTRIATPDGATWRYEYDRNGNMTAAIDPIGATTAFSYTAEGFLTSTTDPLGNVETYTPNAAGLPRRTVDAVGGIWTVDYDLFGRPAVVTDPLGAVTTSTWDAAGRPLSRTLPNGSLQSWQWDSRGNLLAQTDEDGHTTRFEYGPFQTEIARIEPDGTRYAFAYDRELRLTAVLNPAGAAWSYQYDSAGRLAGEQDFDGRRLEYRHDLAGRLIHRTNGAGQAVDLVRDVMGRVVEQRVEGQTALSFEYTARGTLAVARRGADELAYTYDPRGRIISESLNGRAVTSSVDALGRRTDRVTPSGRTSTWAYDAAGRPDTLSGPSWGMSFGYDAAGRETSLRVGADMEIASTWDLLGRLTSRRVLSGADQRVRVDRAWTYQPNGAPVGIADPILGDQNIKVDALGRVTAVRGATWSEDLAYDALGNVVSHTDTRTPESDSAGRRVYAGTRLREAGRTSYEYDGQGRLVRRTRRTLSGGRRVWTYTYDAFDHLIEAVVPDGHCWRYAYDALGRRIRKQRIDGLGAVLEQVEFAWDGELVAEERHSVSGTGRATTTTWDFRPGSGIPVAQDRRVHVLEAPQDVVDARFHAIVTNLVGAPTELVTADGRVAWRSEQGLWGGPIDGGSPQAAYGDGDTCPIRFPGQYRDTETGLDYNFQRYYDPENGRYTTPDPLGLAPAPNHYAYVDNPYTDTDPFGLAKGKSGGGAANSGPPDWAVNELAKIKANNGTVHTYSRNDPKYDPANPGKQVLWEGRSTEPAAKIRKWGAQPAVLNPDGTERLPAFDGSPEWEVPGKPASYKIVGPNRYGDYGYTSNHYGKIDEFKCP